MKTRWQVFSLLATLFLTGCASIVSKSNWPLTVQTTPTGARCVIIKGGVPIQTGETPMTVTLPSGTGYFKRAIYQFDCKKEGYLPAHSESAARLNVGWYIFGNVVFGGLIGWLIVDPATGAMYRLDETHVVSLVQAPGTPAPSPLPAAVPR